MAAALGTLGVAAAVGIGLLFAPLGDGPPAISPTPPTTSTPAGSPTPPGPVAGTVEVDVVPVDNRAAVFGGRTREADRGEVDTFSRQVASWLDGHLADLHAGGEGGIAAVAADGLLDAAPPEVLAAVTTALASPERPIRAAHYEMLVAVDRAPLWLRATVTTTAADGASATAEFVFVPGPSGPALQAAGPGAAA